VKKYDTISRDRFYKASFRQKNSDRFLHSNSQQFPQYVETIDMNLSNYYGQLTWILVYF
jgi:hypothetical protein